MSEPAPVSAGARLETLAYVALLLVLVAPIVLLPAFLTQDGPMHLHNARILLSDFQHGPSSPFAPYYDRNLWLFPYWVGHLGLAALLTLLPPLVAERTFLTASLLLAGTGLRLLLAELDPDATFLAFLGLPLLVGRPFQMGFFDFSFSLGVLFLVARAWLRLPPDPGPARILGLALGLLALYFCHLVTYLVALALLGCLALAGPAPPLRRLPLLALAALPSLVLLAEFFLRAPSYRVAPGLPYPDLLERTLRLDGLVTMTTAEAPVAAAYAAFLVALLLATLHHRLFTPRLDRRDAFLAAALVVLGAHLFGSRNLVGFFERLQVLPFLLLLAWLGTRPWPRVPRLLVMAASAAAVLGLTALRWPRHVAASAAVLELAVLAPMAPPGAPLLPLVHAQRGRDPYRQPITDVTQLFLHVGDYLGAGPTPSVILSNIGGLYPMFPFLWKAGCNPFTLLASGPGFEAEPPEVDLAGYAARTGIAVQCLVTFGHPDPAGDPMLRGFFPAARSPSGLAILYYRVPPPPPSTPR